MKIPIPEMLQRLRQENVKSPPAEQPKVKDGGAKYSRKERAIWRFWASLNTSPVFYRLFLWGGATRFGKLAPKNVGPPWTENHSAPVPARRSLHDLAKAHLNQGDR